MGKRTNTARWTGKMWRIDVQHDGTRKSFYSSRPGRTGQREANAKADAWLDDGINPRGERVAALYPRVCSPLILTDRQMWTVLPRMSAQSSPITSPGRKPVKT